jgi:putative ABC transport system permease protein
MAQDFTFVVPPMGRVTLSIRPEISGAALLVSLGSLLLSLAVFGLEPAIQLARSLDIRTVLAVGATGVRPRVSRQRMIVRWQVAVAAGFFIVATMFIRVTVAQARHDPGIDMDSVALATLGVNAKGTDSARLQRAVDRMLLEAVTTGAVDSVAASTGLPFGIQPALRASIATPGGDREPMSAPAIAATPSLFRVLGIPILSGRGFNDSDGVATARVAVISEMAARQLFPGADPIGQQVVLTIGRDRSAATIVGISRDTDVRALNRPRQPLLYVPLTQHFDRNIVISARPTGRMTSAVAALRRAVQAADPDLRVDISGGARAILSGPLEIFRSAGRGALYLGGFTLLLSMAGLFGVQSHVVAYRTREFGVRMSLGASARQIKTMVIRDGARPVFDGLVLGLWGGIAGRFLVRSYTDLEVAVLDPWMLAVTPVPIVLAALFACYLPASRASRVDPTTALRCE